MTGTGQIPTHRSWIKSTLCLCVFLTVVVTFVVYRYSLWRFRIQDPSVPYRPVTVSFLPGCVGRNSSLDEVEDLFCLPKPAYDPSMKNPCWWSSTVRDASSIKPADNPKATNMTHNVSEGSNHTVVIVNQPANQTLSCLPYFHILCCSKSGTTDLFRRLVVHPDIVPNLGVMGKEMLWWSWAKYGWFNRRPQATRSFSQYLHGFSNLAKTLTEAVRQNPLALSRLVTLDASPPDLWDLRGWSKLPQNRQLRHPAVITPHLMKHLYRDPKFIVLVREPVERLYTSYLFHGMGKTAAEFDRDVKHAIELMDTCMQSAQNRIECFVNYSVTAYLPLFLHYSCYSVYFAEWLKVFPRKHFLFLRTEDYQRSMEQTLLEVFKFLKLPRPSTPYLAKMLAFPPTYHTKSKDSAGPMWNSTRRLLHAWLQPWNSQLAHLLNDDRYLWNDI